MKRLETGLIEDVEYIYDENKKINWLKMIPEEYLYINQDKRVSIEKRLGKNFDEVQISEVLDTELVITLQGIRYLLDLRGYKDCHIKLDVATPEYVAATCNILFIKNEEDFEQSFASCASAHPQNTKSWYKNYLVEAASNRALCRAVRFYLKINIVSREELGMEKNNNDEEPSKPSAFPQPVVMLEKAMKEKNISFDKLKELYKEKSADWKELKDIDKVTMLAIAGRIKKEF